MEFPLNAAVYCGEEKCGVQKIENGGKPACRTADPACSQADRLFRVNFVVE